MLVFRWFFGLLLSLLACWPMALLNAQVPSAPDNAEQVLIILDASGSMNAPMTGGLTKMQAAKRSIGRLLQTLPPNLYVGLRVYGPWLLHSGQKFTLNPCSASYLVAPMALGNQASVLGALSAITPQGATPISYSLIQAMQKDFLPLAGPRRIVLVSDGAETCDADPCGVALDMVRHNVNIKIDVVGLGAMDESTWSQLKCVASATYGKIYKADTVARLDQSLGQAVMAQTSVQGQIILPPSTPKAPASLVAPVGAKLNPPAGLAKVKPGASNPQPKLKPKLKPKPIQEIDLSKF